MEEEERDEPSEEDAAFEEDADMMVEGEEDNDLHQLSQEIRDMQE